jgi:hypothetical protein
MASFQDHYQRGEIAQEAAAALQAGRDPGPGYTATEALLDAQAHALLAIAREMTDIKGLLIQIRHEIAALPSSGRPA